ncbi:MAG TPA: hypothetical protein VGL62_02765 [Vicinamibacterales bacterium]|jgi:hypothetical protein
MMSTSVRFPRAVLFGVFSLLAVSAAVYAADAAKEAAMAARHAVLASKAADIKQVHMHLHHAVNCLVGPTGDGFDANEANPCASLGDGAIPDTTDADMKTTLRSAVKAADAGLASDDLATAQKDAAETAATLQKAK